MPPRSNLLRTIMLCVALLASSCTSHKVEGEPVSTLDYQRRMIPLAQTYPDFEAYKDDPNNLPVAELPRIAGLVKSALIPRQFGTRDEVIDFLFTDVMFPGYGFSMWQLDKPVALYSIEIPQMGEDRWVTMIQKREMWVVVDDFVWPVAKGRIQAAEAEGAHIRYVDRNGSVLRETDIS